MQYNDNLHYRIQPRGNRKKVKDYTRTLLAVLLPFQAIITLISCIPFRESIELTIQVSRREKCSDLMYTTAYSIWSNFLLIVNVLIFLIIIYDIYQIKKAGYKVLLHIVMLFMLRDLYLVYRASAFREKLSYAEIISIIGCVVRVIAIGVMSMIIIKNPQIVDMILVSNKFEMLGF